MLCLIVGAATSEKVIKQCNRDGKCCRVDWMKYNQEEEHGPEVTLLSIEKKKFAEEPADTMEKYISSFSDLENLSIMNCELENIIFLKHFQSEQLVYLNLRNNSLTVLDDNYVNSTKLEYINLSKNKISSIDSKFFENIPNLRHLYLSKNKLRVLNESLFTNLRNIVLIDLHKNDLTYISQDLFKGNPNLEVINLAQTGLGKLGVSVENLFKYNTKLRYFNLMSNELSAFNTEFIKDMKELHVLNLLQNNIIDIDINKLPANVVSLGRNKLSQIYIAKPLKSLKLKSNFVNFVDTENVHLELEVLDISSCTNFSVTEVQKFIHLTTLTLQNCSITQIDRNTFTKSQKLEKLNMASNKIEKLLNGVFDTLIKLQTMNLKNNNINTIEENAFSKLRNLVYLNLAFNKIDTKVTHMNWISPLTQMKYFIVNNNSISSLPKHNESLTKLKLLNLADNELNSINCLPASKSLQALIINNNRLAENLSYDTLKQKYPNLTTIACAMTMECNFFDIFNENAKKNRTLHVKMYKRNNCLLNTKSNITIIEKC